MKIYHNHRAEPYFTFVKNGLKTIETRLQKGKYLNIKPGDHIIVNNKEETDEFKVEVLATRKYKTFRELLENEDIKKVFPDEDNFKNALKTPYQFYTKEQEKEFGVLAIEVKRIK